MKFDKILELAGAAWGAIITVLFGGADMLFLFLGILALVDIILGFVKGAAGRSDKSPKGGFSSDAASKGFQKKGVMLAVLIVANISDMMFNAGGMVRTATMWFYITTEGISILENAALLGVDLPKFLIEMLEVKNKIANDGEVQKDE